MRLLDEQVLDHQHGNEGGNDVPEIDLMLAFQFHRLLPLALGSELAPSVVI
jgi:hypothetical protein